MDITISIKVHVENIVLFRLFQIISMLKLFLSFSLKSTTFIKLFNNYCNLLPHFIPNNKTVG